jgi:histidine ammonia-lyase
MGANAARHALEILENVRRVLAIELVIASQAVDLREKGPERLGRGTAAVYGQVRSRVVFLEHDRALTADFEAVADLIHSGSIRTAIAEALDRDKGTT